MNNFEKKLKEILRDGQTYKEWQIKQYPVHVRDYERRKDEAERRNDNQDISRNRRQRI
jgi:hypothetical protein